LPSIIGAAGESEQAGTGKTRVYFKSEDEVFSSRSLSLFATFQIPLNFPRDPPITIHEVTGTMRIKSQRIIGLTIVLAGALAMGQSELKKMSVSESIAA